MPHSRYIPEAGTIISKQPEKLLVMKNLNSIGRIALTLALVAGLAYGCNNSNTTPNDPSSGQENSQNDQGENYGAKGDNRPEPSNPGADTSATKSTGTGTTQ